MKNVLILIAVLLVAAGVYWKFRDNIHGKIDEVKKADEKGSSPPPIIGTAKDVTPAGSTPKADDKLPLATAEFIRGLPDSLTTVTAADGAKPDLVIELTVAGESGGGLPARIQLTPNVSLDTTAVQLPAGAKDGAMFLVHLQSANPENANVSTPRYVVQCAAVPVPQSLDAGIRAQCWRSSVVLPISSITRPATGAYLWAPDFAEKLERNELQGVVLVEGTFAKHRASGNAMTEVVTLEEAKDIEFHISRRSTWLDQIVEAEKQRRKGHRVTLKMSIDMNLTPKHFIQEVHWGIPLKEQHQYWNQVLGSKKHLGSTLALAEWAESRRLGEQAKAAYEMARGLATRESVSAMGRPARGIRIHMADEVDDQWFYETVPAVYESSHRPIFDGKPSPNAENFQAAARPFCAVLKTNRNAETTGDYYLIQP